jgi:hypothetical protein
MRWLLRLYPAAWRQRYEAEMSDLLDDLPARPGTAIDLIRGAFRAHLGALYGPGRALASSDGGTTMTTQPLQRHPTALAILALVLVAPTLALVGTSILAHELNVPGLAARVDPLIMALTAPRILDLWLLGAPFLAFLIAVVPLFGVSVSRLEGEVRLTVAFRPRVLNVLIAILAVAVGAALIGHIVSEFLLEAPR